MTQYDTGTDTLRCSIADGVAMITLNRPGKRNTLSDELTPALRETLLVMDTHSDVRCVVLTGAGEAFCDTLVSHSAVESSAVESSCNHWLER